MALFTRYWLSKVLFLLLPILIGVLVTRRTTPTPDYLPLHDQSIETLQVFLQNGTLTSEELVQLYLHRIEESTAAFHPVAEINPSALEIARQLDVERKVSGPRSPLHGLPVLVKDSISAHGMNNTAGSLCLVGSKTRKEASIISRLRNAGVIILGKANMSQWGNSRSSPKSQSNGWSAWGGQTLGAFYPNQDPCGSSSGSAVAMSLDLAAFTVGVETVGSMICPASRNNVVGIKTTSGLVARDNVIVTKMRGSIGPFAKTVRDAAIALSIMAGKNAEDPISQEIPFESTPDYEKACKLADFRSIRLAIPQNAFQNPFVQSMNLSAIKKDFEIVVSSFRGHGATIIDDVNYSSYDRINGPSAPQQYVGPAEYKSDMAHYFRGLEINPLNIQNIDDMISCTKSIPPEDYPSRDISYWDTVRNADDVLSEKVVAGIKEMRYLGGAAGIDEVLDASGADAIILPSIVSADVPGLVGYPIITVPMGFSPSDTPVTLNERGNLVWDGPNIPYGLSFIGRPYSEERLIELAYTFEQSIRSKSEGRSFASPKSDLNRSPRSVWFMFDLLQDFYTHFFTHTE